MAKIKEDFQGKVLQFLEKSSHNSRFQESFELKERDRGAHFREEFVVAPLRERERDEIERILYQEGERAESAEQDQKLLITITSEVRAIERQGVLLHGERIAKAQAILKRYRAGAFTEWLLLAYGNRQTPYRMLQYYELFKRLSQDTQSLMEGMPRRAVYVLAGREGDLAKKIAIIEKHHNAPPDEIIEEVQRAFPLRGEDRRVKRALPLDRDRMLIETVEAHLVKLIERKSKLTEGARLRICALEPLFSELLS